MNLKLMLGTAVPAALMLVSAHAQSPSSSPSNPPAASPSPSISVDRPATSIGRPAISAATSTGANAHMQGADQWRVSKLMGLGVYNGANEKIGSIDDIVINPNGEIAKVVIGVGGFLGLGQKDVAVDFKAVRMDRDQNGKPTGHLEMTKDALKSEPTYVFYADTVNPNSPPASAPPRPLRTNP